MIQYREAIFLAWRDWAHERILSLCAILALASMLAPLLVLQGLKNGVTSTMRERLLSDPATLIVTPKSDAGRFSKQFIAELAKLPGASYAIGRTRETANDLTLANPQNGNRVSLAFEPASNGEPLLFRYHISAPKAGADPELVLSQTAATSLKVRPGEKLQAQLGRRTPEGKFESQPITFNVSGILPLAAADRRLAFAAPEVLEDLEDYRDYIAVPSRNFTGEERSGERSYASFRLYATTLDNVAELARYLESKKIEVITRAREIEAIKSLESAINQIILIISIAVGAGFAAFTVSSAEGAIRRKQKMLGMLRLLGFQRMPLTCYPLTQTLLTAIFGFALSLGLYFIVANAIKGAFASRGGLTCSLGIADACLAISIVIIIAIISSGRATWQAANLEPSLVIREV